MGITGREQGPGNGGATEMSAVISESPRTILREQVVVRSRTATGGSVVTSFVTGLPAAFQSSMPP